MPNSVKHRSNKFEKTEETHPLVCKLKSIFPTLCSDYIVNPLPVGYEQPGQRTRCTDRFVRYPYPKQMYSNYKVHFPKKVSHARHHKEAFNLEKESKIINPHRMDLKTTMQEVFQGKRGETRTPKLQSNTQDVRPIQQTSDYQMKFPNWQNGKMDFFHEKKPQYPVY